MSEIKASKMTISFQEPDGTWREIDTGKIDISQDNTEIGDIPPLPAFPSVISFTVHFRPLYNIYWSLVRGCKMISEFFSAN